MSDLSNTNYSEIKKQIFSEYIRANSLRKKDKFSINILELFDNPIKRSQLFIYFGEGFPADYNPLKDYI
jgi:hypothetical protein